MDPDGRNSGAGWRFVGQITSFYHFLNPPSKTRDWILPAEPNKPLFSNGGHGALIGDNGKIYLFRRGHEGEPRFEMLWQC
jgi:hypothetical protein